MRDLASQPVGTEGISWGGLTIYYGRSGPNLSLIFEYLPLAAIHEMMAVHLAICAPILHAICTMRRILFFCVVFYWSVLTLAIDAVADKVAFHW